MGLNVGFLGLGRMGRAMASRLLAAGHSLRVWNRSAGPAAELARQGAVAANRPEDAFAGDVAFSMLADDAALRSVLLDGRVLERAPGGLVHVSMSTISVGLAKEMTALHEARGIRYVAAPVLGRPEAAAAGELQVLAAGPSEAVDRAAPLLGILGKRTWPLGPEPYRANVAKIACNVLLASLIESAAEAMALGQANGLPPGELFGILSQTLLPGPVFAGYGKLIVERKFEPASFRLALGLKDVRLALAAADAASVPLPVAGVVRDNLLDAVAHGEGDRDWSALGEVAFRRAGLSDGNSAVHRPTGSEG